LARALAWLGVGFLLFSVALEVSFVVTAIEAPTPRNVTVAAVFAVCCLLLVVTLSWAWDFIHHAEANPEITSQPLHDPDDPEDLS
jgi:hypothetical protein